MTKDKVLEWANIIYAYGDHNPREHKYAEIRRRHTKKEACMAYGSYLRGLIERDKFYWGYELEQHGGTYSTKDARDACSTAIATWNSIPRVHVHKLIFLRTHTKES